MNLSEHLEDLRKQHDLTQDQLAEKLTVTRQAISRWERGLAYPTVDNLKALAQLYQVSLDTLLMDEPPPPKPVEPAPAEVPEPAQPAPATAPESTQPTPIHPPRGRLALTLAWVAAVLALLALLVAGTALIKISQLEQASTDSTNVWQTGSPQDTNPTITFSFAE